ncbi:MAG: Transcriptional regulatory protein KdpE [Chloroflexi bacterium]|nr:Transcriptional regulatory protein KdpE [Chloroflexota bacterium]
MQHCLKNSLLDQPQGGISGGLDIDLAAGKVTVDGNPVELTPIEWNLLSLLLKNVGRIVPLKSLAKEVWQSDSINRAAIKATVSHLRTKIGDDPYAPRIILSDHEVGYRFLMP